jgi:hypothetical protein
VNYKKKMTETHHYFTGKDLIEHFGGRILPRSIENLAFFEYTKGLMQL